MSSGVYFLALLLLAAGFAGSSPAVLVYKWLHSANIICIFVLCIANRAGIYNAANICAFVYQMNTASGLPVITSGAKWDPASIKINTARGNGKRVINIFLALGFQFRVFVLQRGISDFQIRKLHFQVRNLKHKLRISQSFCQFRYGAGFRTNGFQEVCHA